jgi:DNA-binding YbaB/EbfC family protein
MKGLGNIANLMKQAQQMQQKMAEMQEDLEQQHVTASAGGGMVNVTMNGKQKIISLTISREIVDPNEIDMLQDLILIAVNEAQERAQELMKSRMSELTGGISIPGLTV